MIAKIFEIKRFAVHDGDGIRTTVFFKGCPLQCVWCHNPEGIFSQAELAYYAHKCIACGECLRVCPMGAHTMEEGNHRFQREKCIACGKCETVCLGKALTLYGKEITVEELLPILLQDKAFYDASGGGVTLSGGECLLQVDFCAELLRRLKENGVSTAIDTCGFVSRRTLDKVMPYTDVFLYDIKAADEKVHTRCVGQGNKEILQNLVYLCEKGMRIEVRIPCVPDYNESEMEDIAKLLVPMKEQLQVRLLAYHNYAQSKYEALGLGHTMPKKLFAGDEMAKIKALFSRYGISIVE